MRCDIIGSACLATDAGPKELMVPDGSAHAQFLFTSDQAERVMKEILRFLSASS
jgi:hypothetical protein